MIYTVPNWVNAIKTQRWDSWTPKPWLYSKKYRRYRRPRIEKNMTDRTVYGGKRHHWGMKPLLGVVSTSGNRVDAPWRFGSRKTSCMVEIFQPFPEAADPSWDCRVDRLFIMVLEVAYTIDNMVETSRHSQFSFHPKQRNCHRTGSQFPATFEFHTHCVQANSCPGPNIWTTNHQKIGKMKK